MAEQEFPWRRAYATPEYLRGIPDLRKRMSEALESPSPSFNIEQTRAHVEKAVMTVLRLSPGPETGKENRVLIEPADDSGMNWYFSLNIIKPGCDFTTEGVLIEGISAEDLSSIFYGKEDNGDIWENQGTPTWKKDGKVVEGEENGATFEVVRHLELPHGILKWTLKHTTQHIPRVNQNGFRGHFSVKDSLEFIPTQEPS